MCDFTAACDASLQAMLLPRVEQEQALATAIEVCTITILFCIAV
jgi:hypothetical protein